MPTRVRRTAT